jgi:uncharacterized Rmd1/YagE family protein
MLNLHSELLETPDVYWEEPNLGHLFDRMADNLDIPNRISILNKRLDYMQEVTEVVRTYMTNRTAHFLEKIIVILIAVEVLFHLMDKSKWWRSLTWEGVLGIEGPDDLDAQSQQNANQST